MKLVIPKSKYQNKAIQKYYEPFVVPALNISYPHADKLRKSFTGNFDWLVVTSQNAVNSLSLAGINPYKRFKVAAVGKKTAEACNEQLGLSVDFVPNVESANGILADNPISGKVLLPNSNLAPKTLADGLTEQGCEVNSITAYDVEIIKDRKQKAEIQQLLKAREIAGFYCTSPSVASCYLWLSSGFHEKVSFQAIGETTEKFLDKELGKDS
ncbi:MAG: uroporphyrinogen-III synthase [Micrococcaceae bacterium]